MNKERIKDEAESLQVALEDLSRAQDFFVSAIDENELDNSFNYKTIAKYISSARMEARSILTNLQEATA